MGWQLPLAPRITNDPAVCLVADGRRLTPASVADGRYVFVLWRADAPVRLVSRSAVPNEMRPWVSDDRRLGVMVGALVMRSGSSVWPIALDHPAFGEGWWAPEWHGPSALRRWTNGDARVPVPDIRDLLPGAYLLEVDVAGTVPYPLSPACGEQNTRPTPGVTGRHAGWAARP